MASTTKELGRLDLSTFKKPEAHNGHHFIERVQNYLSKTFSDVTDINEVVSCYRNGSESKGFVAYEGKGYKHEPIQDRIRCLFFPFWILLALVPQEGKTLTIGNICLTKYKREQDETRKDIEIPYWIHKQVGSNIIIGKGVLVVKQLTVVCTTEILFDIRKLREELHVSSLANIIINSCKLKVIITPTVVIEKRLEELLSSLRSSVQLPDELKLMIGDELNGAKVDIGAAVSISDDELEELDADIPLVGGDYISPHRMFGGCYGYPYNAPVVSVLQCQQLNANGILIATLGYGYDSNIKRRLADLPNYPKGITVKCEKNFVSDTALVYNAHLTSAHIIDDFTKTASFVICQTTYCDGTIANGATSEAINWLKEEWNETWKKEYDNLVVLIPYGGGYREDEMKAITRATDEGIIIVCAAGNSGGGVVFPAAYGNVLSVGVAGTGPSGREVDTCASYLNVAEMHVSDDSGTTAAHITGLLSLLLSQINYFLKSPSSCCAAIANAIKQVPGYLHTCVIRELLMNDGAGSHDPRQGYGNGSDIILKLLSMNATSLLQKLANILLKYPVSENPEQSVACTSSGVSEEVRTKLFLDFKGDGVTVAVLDNAGNDCNDELTKEELGPSCQTSMKTFKMPLEITEDTPHGDRCAVVVKSLCPNTSVIRVNNLEEKDLSPGFVDCGSDSAIDIISYSISSPYFDLNLCQAVNEAVIAGKIVVFAAGNTGQRLRNTIGYPGRIGNILVVGGRDQYHNRINFSSIGRELDFLADADLEGFTGTSFAAPTVAAYIAFLLQFIKQMNEKGNKFDITAWSKNPNTSHYEWRPISILEAAHNVYAVRFLLKELMVAKPQAHSEKEGYGSLDFSQLFPSYCFENAKDFTTSVAENLIHDKLQKFYK